MQADRLILLIDILAETLYDPFTSKVDESAIATWLNTQNRLVTNDYGDYMRPIKALQEGRFEMVLSAAESYVNGDPI